MTNTDGERRLRGKRECAAPLPPQLKNNIVDIAQGQCESCFNLQMAKTACWI